MSNVDSSGKFGRSMDYSQLLEARKRYVTVQRQNTKVPAGDQTQKPFLSEHHLTKGFENGVVDYYFTRGLYPVFNFIRNKK